MTPPPDLSDYIEHQPGVFLHATTDPRRFDVRNMTRKHEGRVFVTIDANSSINLNNLFVSGDTVLSVGEGSVIRGSNIRLIGRGAGLHIGCNFLCGPTLFIAKYSDIRIGDDVLFSHGLTLRTSDMHSIYDAATGKRINPAAPIRIADHVWLGQDVIVLKGSSIGRDCVVAARALVSGEIAPGTLAGGCPARPIRSGITWDRSDKPVT